MKKEMDVVWGTGREWVPVGDDGKGLGRVSGGHWEVNWWDWEVNKGYWVTGRDREGSMERTGSRVKRGLGRSIGHW